MLLDMAGLKISQLTKLEQMTGTEAIPVEKGGENYSMTPDVLLKDVKGGMAGLVTRLNDYAYDVSLLMGKMAVRGTKGTPSNTQPNDQGYYNMDGAFVLGGTTNLVNTFLTETDKIYYFDIGYYNLQGLVNPAVLVLFDKDDKVLTAIPWAEGGFHDKYLVFTSEVKKYGVTYMFNPIVKPFPPIIAETYEIQDINDVLSGISEKSNSMRDDFNNYVYDISGLLGKLAYRDGIGTDEKNIQGDGYFNSKGILVQSSGAGFVYQKLEIDLSKIYRIRQMVGSYSTVSALVLFDEHDEIISAVPYNYTSVSSDKYFVFAGVHSVGISFVKSDNNSRLESFDIQDLTTALNEVNAKSDSMRDDFNNYISDVTDLFGKMAYREGVGTDLANPTAGSYIRLSDGVLVQADDSFSYQYVDVDSTKCYHLQNLISGSSISMLAMYDKNGALIKSYRDKIDGYFVFKGVSRIGLSGTTASIQRQFTIQSFDISDITTVINTSQGNRALYIAAGAVYNEQTGFYELNGLTDITEEQMRNIYVYTSSAINQNDLRTKFSNLPIRTNLPFKANSGDYFGEANIGAMFATNHTIEVINIGSTVYPNYISYAFIQCDKLRKILTIINLNNYRIDTPITTMFQGCILLEYVRIQKIKQSISFSDSPLLSLESLQYLITNATNTSAITVTVHADVYAKIQDESQTEWHALIEAAAAKQITFATV